MVRKGSNTAITRKAFTAAPPFNLNEKALKQVIETEETLLCTLLEKQIEYDHLKKKHKELQKEIKKLETSRKMKLARFYWEWLESFKKVLHYVPFCRTYISLKKLNKELTIENNLLKKHVEESKPSLQNEIVDPTPLKKMLKKTKEDGGFTEYLENIIRDKAMYSQAYSSALKYAGRLYQNEPEKLRTYVYNKVLSGLQIQEIPEFIVRNGEDNRDISLQPLSSFRANVGIRSRKRQLREQLPESILDDKRTAYHFVDGLGIRRPWVLDGTYADKEIPKRTGMVIKPADGAGSRGVYLVFEDHYIQDVKRGEILPNWETLQERMKLDLDLAWVHRNEWMIEELLTENGSQKPPRDLKFYCFYGEVALVLEIERYPELKYCWWDIHGHPIRTGKYEHDLFIGKGFTADDIKLAANMSLEIPTPFIRIDFLKTETEMIFGEFTPKPGNYDEFDQMTDQFLGDCFLKAENRLLDDLIRGKRFHNFFNQ